VDLNRLFEIVKTSLADESPGIPDVKVAVGDPDSVADTVSEKSSGVGVMLQETVADAKVVVSYVTWLGIGGSAGPECNNCGS
jgi:hypothetical protein